MILGMTNPGSIPSILDSTSLVRVLEFSFSYIHYIYFDLEAQMPQLAPGLADNSYFGIAH